MMRWISKLTRDERGLTAIELAVVVAILAVLAAIVAGNTTGMSTAARGSSKATDIAEVQKAVDNYKGQNPTSGYPVVGDTKVLTMTRTAIDFQAKFTTPDTVSLTRTFMPDFLQRNVKHYNDTKSGEKVWYLTEDGEVMVDLIDSEY